MHDHLRPTNNRSSHGAASSVSKPGESTESSPRAGEQRRSNHVTDGDRSVIPANWLRTFRLGLGLVMLSLLLMDLGPNLFGFVLPMFNGSRDDLVWAGYIRGAGRLVGFTAVLLLTYHSTRVGRGKMYVACGVVFQAFVALELLCVILLYVLPFSRLNGFAGMSIALRAGEIMRNLAGAAFVAVMSHELSLPPLDKRFTSVAVAYSILLVCDYLTQATSRRYIQPASIDLLWIGYAVLWLITMRLLVVMRKKTSDLLIGACAQCGYLLCGSPDRRCSECGKVNPQVGLA